MIALALLLLQPEPAPPTPAAGQAAPDIQVDARLTARRVVVVNRGEVDLSLRASHDGGTLLDVQAPDLPAGQRELRNVDVRVRAEVRVADPANILADTRQTEEPPAPQ